MFADTFAALMAQLETQTKPVTVLIVQADTNGFSAAQLQEVLSYPLVNVVMLSVQGAEPSTELDDFLRELGIADLQAGLEPNTLISLTPQLQVMKLTNDGVSAVYGALETLLLNMSAQVRLSLTKTETASTVLLPAKGAANVLLVLSNLPQGSEVVITDESGTVISPKETYQSADRAMYELENVGGMLTVAAHAPQPAQPEPSAEPAAAGAETAADTLLPTQSPAAVDAAPETPAPAATAQPAGRRRGRHGSVHLHLCGHIAALHADRGNRFQQKRSDRIDPGAAGGYPACRHSAGFQCRCAAAHPG